MKTKQKVTRNIRFNTFKLDLWTISLLMIVINIISTQSQQKMNILRIFSNNMHSQEIPTKTEILQSKKYYFYCTKKSRNNHICYITIPEVSMYITKLESTRATPNDNCINNKFNSISRSF
eukprot:UN11473